MWTGGKIVGRVYEMRAACGRERLRVACRSSFLLPLVAVDDNLVLCLLGRDDARGEEEVLDGGTLVALELEHLAVLVLLGRGGRVLVVRLGRVDDVAVARKLLLHGLEELAGVVLVRDTLDGGDGLAAIALLKTWRESANDDNSCKRGEKEGEAVGRSGWWARMRPHRMLTAIATSSRPYTRTRERSTRTVNSVEGSSRFLATDTDTFYSKTHLLRHFENVPPKRHVYSRTWILSALPTLLVMVAAGLASSKGSAVANGS